MNADGNAPMNAETRREWLDGISRITIGAAQAVNSKLGFGFLEKVYENALAIELRNRGMNLDQQHPIRVRYGEEIVGDYIADLLIEGSIVVEVKAVSLLNRAHHAQCINYLRATGLSVCLLLNFGRPRLELKRIVWNF
jgi:GxxExxY protein